MRPEDFLNPSFNHAPSEEEQTDRMSRTECSWRQSYHGSPQQLMGLHPLAC